MPVRGYKIKPETQSSEQPNLQIKSIEDINPDDVFFFADQFQLFRKSYPDDPESEVADKIFAMMEVLEHFRTNIINSPFLSPKDQLSRCRSNFNKALSQHQTNTIQGRVVKSQLAPSAYLQTIPSIKKLLESTFANIDIDEMIKCFNASRTEINALVQNLSQIHQKFQTRDKEFQQSYSDFQKTKKTFVTQVNQLREYHQSRRCTSLVVKNNYLLGHYKILCKVLNQKQMNIRDKGINYFNEITQYFLEIKAAYLGLNITQKIDLLLTKLDSEKVKQNDTQGLSDNEYDEDSENHISSKTKIELHKSRNRRNTRTTSINSKPSKKNVKNLLSTKDDNNYYEYEEEEEEEDIIEEEYEEEEEEEEYEEEEEEEEEEEIEEVIVNQPKRNRRPNTSKSEQTKKAENSSNSNNNNNSSNSNSNNRRTRSSSRSSSNSTTTASSSSSTTNQQRSSMPSRQSSSSNDSTRNKRGSRSRSRTESSTSTNSITNNSNDKQNSSVNKSSEQSNANKRGRSRNSNNSNTSNTNAANSSSNLASSNDSSVRSRRGQTLGIAARIKESGISSSSRSKSSNSGQNNDFSSSSSQLQSRRSKRRRNQDGNTNESTNDSAKSSSQNTKEGSSNTSTTTIHNTRSRGRDKESQGQSSSSIINNNSSNNNNIGTSNSSIIGSSSLNNNGLSGQGKGKGRYASNEAETKQQTQERKLVYNQIKVLTIPLMEIIGRDSLLDSENDEENNNNDDAEFPSLIIRPLIDLYKSEHPTESGLNSAFIKSCKEFKSFLDGINFELFPIKLFYMIHEIEIYKIINNINNKNIDQLITSISLLPDKLNKYQQVQQIETINIELLDQLTKLINTEENSETTATTENNFGSEPTFLLNIFEEVFKVLTPIVCLIKTIMPFNSHIKANKLTRSCDYLYIPYNNYLDRQSNNLISSMHLQPYNSVPFKSVKPNQDFDSFIFFICQEIEKKDEIKIFDKTFVEFNCMNIYVPKINELLNRIQSLISILFENGTTNDENLNQISSNLLTKIYEINKIIELEKLICKVKNSPSNLASLFDFGSLLTMIKTLRDIHFLFIALDGRKIISYSNALNMTYSRMFVEQICEEDILDDQLLCAPIDPNKSIKIRNILNRSQIESMEEKLKNSYLVRMKSFDYFPSKYFFTLYNIENIKLPALKAAQTASSSTLSSISSASSIYPPELSDLIYLARLKPKKQEENHQINENEIEIVKNIFGIEKDLNSFDSKYGNSDSCINALSDIYLDLLEMIAVKDKIFAIPSSLSNFLSLRSQSNEFAEKISITNNFKEFVLIFHETFKINVVTIINTIITEIENTIIQPQKKEENDNENDNENENEGENISPESYEKVVAYLILTVMKRGYLSTVTVAQFVKFITDENNLLHELFCMNEKLVKNVLDLCKVVMFIDIHDKIISSISSISNVSILRNINLGLFLTSMSKSLLFLNTTMTIIISNQSNFTISDLTEMNRYGKFVLSHVNEIDRYQKENLVESIKLLYQILPVTSDINNELSEEKMKKIDPEQKEKTFLKISCSNIKMEIDDFIRFQSDSKKRTLKMTNPILLQLANSTISSSSNNKNIILFCIYAFDVPKSVYTNEFEEKRSYVSNVEMKQQKREERLKKVDEILQLKEMQYVASSDSLFIPIPCSLLSKDQQELMAKYYKKLQDERDELVVKEKMFQEFLEKKENLLRQAQEQSVKRKELIDKFYSVRERLKQVAQKAQQQQELQKRRLEKEQMNNFPQPIINQQNQQNQSSLLRFENDAILASQHLKNTASIKKIQNDLKTLEKRTRLSLECNRNFKNVIVDLNKKYEDRQNLVSSSSSSSTPSLQKSTPSSRDLDEFGVKDLESLKIDEFVKNSLIEMNLASEKTFDEIEKTANEIKKLEEGAADEEAEMFSFKRIKDITQSSDIPPEEKENLIALINEIMMLKQEKESIQSNQS